MHPVRPARVQLSGAGGAKIARGGGCGASFGKRGVFGGWKPAGKWLESGLPNWLASPCALTGLARPCRRDETHRSAARARLAGARRAPTRAPQAPHRGFRPGLPDPRFSQQGIRPILRSRARRSGRRWRRSNGSRGRSTTGTARDRIREGCPKGRDRVDAETPTRPRKVSVTLRRDRPFPVIRCSSQRCGAASPNRLFASVCRISLGLRSAARDFPAVCPARTSGKSGAGRGFTGCAKDHHNCGRFKGRGSSQELASRAREKLDRACLVSVSSVSYSCNKIQNYGRGFVAKGSR